MEVLNSEISLGVQSWCFREFRGSEALVEQLKKSGLDTIELCFVHCDFSSEDIWKKTIDEITAAGVKINSFGVEGYGNNEEDVRRKFEFAKYAGIKAASADVDMDAIPLLEKLCDEYGVKLAIHNHGKNHRYGSIEQLKEIFSKSSDNIGLCLDTGWALDSGVDPVEYIELFKDRLYGVHLKDFNFDENGHPLETVLGTGELNLKAVIDKLNDIGFDGYISLEYEGDASEPAPKLKACAENLSKI